MSNSAAVFLDCYCSNAHLQKNMEKQLVINADEQLKFDFHLLHEESCIYLFVVSECRQL